MLNKILCGATLLCAATLSNAALIDQTTVINLADTATDFNQAIALAQFDSGLGTLTNVMLTVDGDLTTTASVTNADATPAEITINLSGALGLSYAMGASIIDASGSDSTTFTAAPSAVTVGGLNLDISAFMGSFSDMTTLGNFTGPGTINLTYDASALSLVGGPGNIQTDISTVAGGTITVKYTYDDGVQPPVGVSAPSHVALLGLGLLGFAGLRKIGK